jgi:(2Fe-2S) ferredoxin
METMPRFQRHIFICTNRRSPGHPKGCCAEKGSELLQAQFKAELKRRGIASDVRANASGCLDACSHGANIVIYPEGVWYGGVTAADIPEIIDRHIIGGEVVQRLLIDDEQYASGAEKYPPLK